MTLRELLAEIAPAALEGITKNAQHEDFREAEGTHGPLAVQIFTALGTWVGALMVSAIVGSFAVHKIVPLSLFLGAAFMLWSIKLSRDSARSLVKTQLIWAFTVAAQALLVSAVSEADVDDNRSAVAGMFCLLNMLTIAWVRVSSLQLAATIALVCAATWLAHSLALPFAGLWVAIPASVLAAWIWIFEAKSARRLGTGWLALAYGLPVGMAVPLILVMDDFAAPGIVAPGIVAPIATAAIFVLIVWVLFSTKNELLARQQPVPPCAYALVPLAMALAIVGRNTPGLTLAFLWLLIAHLRGSRALHAIALTQLSAFLWLHYYQLATPLLHKSIGMLLAGTVILCATFLLRTAVVWQPISKFGGPRRLVSASALVALTSGLLVFSVLKKENVLATGETLLLRLAPKDPRSLMQGDYMVLRYFIEDEMALAKIDFAKIPRHGHLVVDRRDNQVGHFVRMDNGSPLNPTQLKLEYRVRCEQQGCLRLGAEAFYFEEGSAKIYETAHFGELVVSEDGELVLVGLRDKDREQLGIRL